MAKEKASLEYAKAVERVQKELVKQIFDLQKQGLSKNEILLVLQGLDMEDIILNQLKLNADIDKLMLEYENVLGAMEMTGAVTAESLTALQRIDRNSFAKQAGVMGELIKKEVARGILVKRVNKMSFPLNRQHLLKPHSWFRGVNTLKGCTKVNTSATIQI